MPPRPGDSLGPQSTALLLVVDACLHSAHEALVPRANDADVRDVGDDLMRADELFASVVGSAELDGHAAQRIQAVRDDLGYHVEAVALLQDAGAPAAPVLRRAVEAAQERIAAELSGAAQRRLQDA
jgi:hypothetical protein